MGAALLVGWVAETFVLGYLLATVKDLRAENEFLQSRYFPTVDTADWPTVHDDAQEAATKEPEAE